MLVTMITISQLFEQYNVWNKQHILKRNTVKVSAYVYTHVILLRLIGKSILMWNLNISHFLAHIHVGILNRDVCTRKK